MAGHVKNAHSDSNLAEQFTLGCRQLIKSLVTILCEKCGSSGSGKDSRFENSFLLDFDGNSSYLSCGTNKGQDNASFDQPRHDRVAYSTSQVANPAEVSITHIESRNAVVCILKGNELFGVTSGESQFLLIHFVGTSPEFVPLNKVASHETHSEANAAVELLREENKKELELPSLDDAAVFSAKVQDRDLVILGSTNLFGTVGQGTMLKVVREQAERRGFHETFPQNVAKEIAAVAADVNSLPVPTSFDIAKNEDVFSPFIKTG